MEQESCHTANSYYPRQKKSAVELRHAGHRVQNEVKFAVGFTEYLSQVLNFLFHLYSCELLLTVVRFQLFPAILLQYTL